MGDLLRSTAAIVVVALVGVPFVRALIRRGIGPLRWVYRRTAKHLSATRLFAYLVDVIRYEGEAHGWGEPFTVQHMRCSGCGRPLHAGGESRIDVVATQRNGELTCVCGQRLGIRKRPKR